MSTDDLRETARKLRELLEKHGSAGHPLSAAQCQEWTHKLRRALHEEPFEFKMVLIAAPEGITHFDGEIIPAEEDPPEPEQ